MRNMPTLKLEPPRCIKMPTTDHPVRRHHNLQEKKACILLDYVVSVSADGLYVMQLSIEFFYFVLWPFD